MNVFTAIANFFRRLTANAPKAAETLDSISGLIKLALPVVQLVAAATPNRTDDEVLALIAQVGLPLEGRASDWLRNPALVKDALRASAVALLRKQGITESDNTVNAAIELAYSIVKTEAAHAKN